MKSKDEGLHRETSLDMEPPAKRLKPTVSLDDNLVSQAPASSSSSSPLFEDITFPQDKALQNERIKWKRPKEICDCPRFIVDGATRMDVCQGNLSNCWFLSAVACLSLYPQLLEQVVPIDQDFGDGYNGKFRFQFWQYGRWVEIVVDDLLPTVPVQNNGKTQYDLLFVHSKDKDEFWSSLLEKAYAKLKGGYSTLQMGFAGEALEDMTGGVVQSCDTSGPTSDLWSHLHNMLQRGALICCGNTQGEIETSNLMGILSYHMYSVTGTKEVQTLYGSVSLLRVRNPWGHTEWMGPWRDGGPEWQSVKDPEESENVILEDGEFWMAVDDFQNNFHFLEICHLGPQSIMKIGAAAKPWEYITYEGRWVKGLSAGGSLISSDCYWLNPQFSLILENNNDEDNSEPQTLCSFIVSVMQKHQRLRRTGHIRVACHIFQGADTHVYIFQDALRSFQPLLSAGPCDNHREVVLCSSLPPGRYIIIPSLEKESDEGEFLIRILTEKGNNGRPLEMNAKCGEIPALSPFPTDDQCIRWFLQFANQEGRVNNVQLHKLLAWLLTELAPHLPKFTLEICRSLMASMDISAAGSLDSGQFCILWKKITAGTCIFANLHKDKTDRVSGDQLVAALQSAGLPADDFLVRLAQVRYGDPDGFLSYPDYICCLLKLQSLTEKFQAADPFGSGEVTLNYRQWLLLAVFS
ncbi:calpain-12 isoform X2 [Dendrobates tinctorius]|uniref:calpain-12 isoform X2 n=1 Tax=Dendrobates tinctorius TaxID=92724 RepID=UPI003CC9BA23